MAPPDPILGVTEAFRRVGRQGAAHSACTPGKLHPCLGVCLRACNSRTGRQGGHLSPAAGASLQCLFFPHL